MSNYTMVCRFTDTNSGAYTYIFVDERYKIISLDGEKVKKGLADNTLLTTNLGLKDGKIVGTNGSLENYITIDQNNKFLTGEHIVILNRIEKNDVLIGYTAYMPNGMIKNISVDTAVRLAKAKDRYVSNGKIRHTNDRDIVQSILGDFPIRKYTISEQASQKENQIVEMKIYFICHAENMRGDSQEYFAASLSSTDGARLSLIGDTLSSANKELMEKVNRLSDSVKLASLNIIPFKNGGFYGVYPIRYLRQLLRSQNFEVSGFRNDLAVVNAIKYTGDSVEEAAISVNLKSKEVSKLVDKTNVTNVNKDLIDFYNRIKTDLFVREY